MLIIQFVGRFEFLVLLGHGDAWPARIVGRGKIER